MGGSATNSPVVQNALANLLDAATQKNQGEQQFLRINPDDYNTKLSEGEEKKFQYWKQKYAPRDSGYDYDLRGAYKEGLKPDPLTGHWPDTYKKPNHETFSDESKYADYTAGTWTGPNHDIYQKPLPLPTSNNETKPKFVNNDKGLFYNSLDSFLNANSGGLNKPKALGEYTRQASNIPDAIIRGAGDAVSATPDMAIAAGKLMGQAGLNPRGYRKQFEDTTYMPINPAVQDMLTRAGVAETEGANNLTRFVSSAMLPFAGGKYVGAVGDAIGAAKGGALSNAQRGMFAGVGAKNADLKALKVAEKLEANGVDKDAIWSQTGWGRGTDGMWRFEIDDSKAILNDILDNADGLGLGGVISHPDVRANYPQTDKLSIDRMRQLGGNTLPRGSYNRAILNNVENEPFMPSIMIDAKDAVRAKDIGLHEIQHNLQDLENFGRGGSSINAFSFSGPDSATSLYKQMRKDIRKPLTLDDYVQKAWGGVKSEFAVKDYDLYLKSLKKPISANIDRVLQETAAKEWYRRQSGEVEARNVQTRMNMTPAERLLTPPWKTEDVARDKQIVRFGGGKSMSLPTDDLPSFSTDPVDVSISKSPNMWTIGKIATDPKYRGKGLADQKLKSILAEADAAGVPVSLTPSSDFGASKSRLTDWYENNGFVKNSGRNKDFTTRETMIRPPQSVDLPMDEVSRMARGMSEDEFIKHHRTGYIGPDAYARYEADGGLAWLGGPKVDPITKLPPEYQIIRDGKKFYVGKSDSSDARNLLRGYHDTPEGASAEMLKFINQQRGVGSSKNEMYPDVLEKITGRNGKEFDVRRNNDGMVVFDGDRPVGLVSNEFGSAGVWVEKPYQRQGIGSELLTRFMRENPEMKLGQMTYAGEKLSRSVYKKMSAK